MPDVPVGPGTRVTLRFAILLTDGKVVENVESATFSVGDGNLLPGFEKALFGMRAGETASIEIPAAEAFGESNDENIQRMRRGNFQDIELAEGLVVSFRDGEGNEMPGVVKRIVGELVEVDFNHPLAGRDLVFDVGIDRVEQISNEIIRG